MAPDGTPSPRLKARLDTALAPYRARRASIVFVSGGIGKEGFDEAQVMARYLAQHGVHMARHVHAPYAELRGRYSIPREVVGLVAYFFTAS